jgi:hypothetical protein
MVNRLRGFGGLRIFTDMITGIHVTVKGGKIAAGYVDSQAMPPAKEDASVSHVDSELHDLAWI